MNQQWLLDRIATADRYVADGQRLLARQREIVEQLSRKGQDVTANTELLHQFQRSLERHIRDRDRLRSAL